MISGWWVPAAFLASKRRDRNGEQLTKERRDTLRANAEQLKKDHGGGTIMHGIFVNETITLLNCLDALASAEAELSVWQAAEPERIDRERYLDEKLTAAQGDRDAARTAFTKAQAEVVRLQEERAELLDAASALVAAMETCHQCQAVLIVEDGPTYCSEGGCSYDCEGHAECTRISVLHDKMKRMLASR